MSSTLGLRPVSSYQPVPAQAGRDTRVPLDDAHRTAAPNPQAPVGLLTAIRRRITGEGTAAEHLAAFNPNGETFAQKHAGAVMPAAYVGAVAAVAAPVLGLAAAGFKFGAYIVSDGKNEAYGIDQYAVGGVFSAMGGLAGAIPALGLVGACYPDKALKALTEHAEFTDFLKSASFTDITGQDRTDAVIKMVKNFFNQTASRVTAAESDAGASNAESGRAAMTAKPELIAAMQALVRNNLQDLVNIAATPSAAMLEGSPGIQTQQLKEAARASNRSLMNKTIAAYAADKSIAPFKKLMTHHMNFGGDPIGKKDFLEGYKDTLFGDVLMRPAEISSSYPYMPMVNARKSTVIQDSFGDDCRAEIQDRIIDPLHAALIKPADQDIAKINNHIQAVRTLIKAISPVKLADIATIVNADEPHAQAQTAAGALVPSETSGAQSPAQLAFLKVYRGILESAGVLKPIIRQTSRQLDAQKVIDTLLRPEKLVRDVQDATKLA
jgi:hypothetical protein